jgi:NADPH:quinone reductase-like Zn-dependent oxidoreductase
VKAAVITRYGGQEAIAIQDVPQPHIEPNEVLVEVHAAGLNPFDIKTRNGKVAVIQPCRFPQPFGLEFAGKVARTGAKVSRFKQGDAVFGIVIGNKIGAIAEYCAIPEADLCLKPPRLSFEEAAGIPLVGLTVYQALIGVAKVRAGQKVFITAGSGGIGTFAIQFAKALGAEVATTTSTGNVELVTKLGADHVIDYKKQNFEEILKDYDVVLDSVGGASIIKGFEVLKPEGHLISIADKPDATFAKAFGLNPAFQFVFWMLSRDVTSVAQKKGMQYTFLYVRPSGAQLSEIGKLIESERIKPVIDSTFSFDQTRAAQAHLELGRSKGKVIVKVKSDPA